MKEERDLGFFIPDFSHSEKILDLQADTFEQSK